MQHERAGTEPQRWFFAHFHETSGTAPEHPFAREQHERRYSIT